MKILLIDIDSIIPNLALKKIERYHLLEGDDVKWNLPLWRDWADKIYVSCIFEENREKCLEWEGSAAIGGSGYNLSVRLPEAIESVKPKINMGFTTRGCIRNCGFCIVPAKEGGIRVVGDLLDLWDGKSKDIMLMDNNILAVPDHFRMICEQAREHKLRVDFNQGLDHRLLTPEIARELTGIRHKEYRFAYDSPRQHYTVVAALKTLSDAGMVKAFWYVLVGYDTDFEQDLGRLEYLRAMGQTVFVQRYSKNRGNLLLGQWANRHACFRAMTFWQFMKLERNAKYYRKYQDEIESYFGNADLEQFLVDN